MSKFINKKVILAVVIIAALIFVGFNCLTVVEPGHTGVVVTLGKVENHVLQEGLHFKIPFVQEIVKIDNRIIKLRGLY